MAKSGYSSSFWINLATDLCTVFDAGTGSFAKAVETKNIPMMNTKVAILVFMVEYFYGLIMIQRCIEKGVSHLGNNSFGPLPTVTLNLGRGIY